MKYIDEYRDRDISSALVKRIAALKGEIPHPVKIMEICGTHTVAISKSGIRQLLPEDMQIISGPGCPVCVTPLGEVDAAIDLASRQEVILTTYGDMVRVPGTASSLQELKASGRDIRVVYSSLDALEIAEKNPERQVVFLAVGFETTAPASALAIQRARERGIGNFSVLCLHKVIPPALQALLPENANRIDGFICPGHVSVIIGARAYECLARAGKAAVITGFEPLDILEGLWLIVRQIRDRDPKVEIQYVRAVTWEGNRTAQREMEKAFEPCTASWRGLGEISESGLRIREEFRAYDAAARFGVTVEHKPDPSGCSCGDILRGMMLPHECALFGTACNPSHPVGPCMVSSEGACAAYYKFSQRKGKRL